MDVLRNHCRRGLFPQVPFVYGKKPHVEAAFNVGFENNLSSHTEISR